MSEPRPVPVIGRASVAGCESFSAEASAPEVLGLGERHPGPRTALNGAIRALVGSGKRFRVEVNDDTAIAEEVSPTRASRPFGLRAECQGDEAARTTSTMKQYGIRRTIYRNKGTGNSGALPA